MKRPRRGAQNGAGVNSKELSGGLGMAKGEERKWAGGGSLNTNKRGGSRRRLITAQQCQAIAIPDPLHKTKRNASGMDRSREIANHWKGGARIKGGQWE